MHITTSASIDPTGLAQDRYGGRGKRAVTMIQAEHLPVIAALAGHDEIVPETLRRNLVISGLNLIAARKATLQIGSAQITLTGPCAPCSKMETALGPGGYNAMRGHGGWTAEVTRPGIITVGDTVTVLPKNS